MRDERSQHGLPARPEMERRQSGARLIFYRADRARLSLRFRGPVESKSRSARSGPRSRASINILTYTTWNSRLIYCRYLGALVFGPPGADIICLKKCARQRGSPTTVLPILRGSGRPAYGRPLVSVSRSFSFSPPSPSSSPLSTAAAPLSPPLPRFTRRSSFGPGEIVLRSTSAHRATPVGSNR